MWLLEVAQALTLQTENLKESWLCVPSIKHSWIYRTANVHHCLLYDCLNITLGFHFVECYLKN